MNNLREVFRKYKAVVFFDVETTGLDAKTCRIIELAAIRIERAGDGTLYTAGRADMLIKLPDGQRIPEKITELTGITDEQLEASGVTEYNAAAAFAFEFLTCGPVLLVAHNAQFDLSFTQEMLGRYGDDALQLLKDCDYLDSLTVYKDRRAYPHKLANAIAAYKLEDKVQNSHRAIDDVAALFEVCKAMDDERADLLEYVNIFGYNPKYGVGGPRIDGVTYWPQRFNKFMQSPGYTLPALAKKQMTDTTLTKEQREFAAENHEIILSYLRGKRLDASEWYDVAVFGYLRAVRKYTERPELQIYAFSTIAGKAMDTEIGNERKKQKRRIQPLSLDAPLTEDGLTFYDTISTPDFTEDKAEMSAACASLLPLLQMLTEHQLEALTLKSNSYTRSQIGDVMGITARAADSAIARGRYKLRRAEAELKILEAVT